MPNHPPAVRVLRTSDFPVDQPDVLAEDANDIPETLPEFWEHLFFYGLTEEEAENLSPEQEAWLAAWMW